MTKQQPTPAQQLAHSDHLLMQTVFTLRDENGGLICTAGGRFICAQLGVDVAALRRAQAELEDGKPACVWYGVQRWPAVAVTWAETGL